MGATNNMQDLLLKTWHPFPILQHVSASAFSVLWNQTWLSVSKRPGAHSCA